MGHGRQRWIGHSRNAIACGQDDPTETLYSTRQFSYPVNPANGIALKYNSH